MKKRIDILLSMCLLSMLFVGCGAKETADVSGNAVSGNLSNEVSSSRESEKLSETVTDPHTPIISSSFELNGVRFWHHDDVEMECLVVEELHLAEITLNGTMLHVNVMDKKDETEWYNNIVERGTKAISTSGDICYKSITDFMWEVATESGKLITLYGDKDSGDDWKEIGKMIEWTVINGEDFQTAGTFNMGSAGIKYQKPDFTIKNGMFEPAAGSTLTPAGQPLVLGSITISEVLLSDTYEYRKDSDVPSLEEKACYDFDMISIQVGEDEWGMGPLLSYLVPSDATITFYPSEDNMSFWFDGYDLFIEEGSDTWKQTRLGGYKATVEDMDPVVFTLDEFKKYFPDMVCLSCSADGEYWYDMMFVD